MERFVWIFESNNIEYLLSDREFVGDKWQESSNRLNIEYYIRVCGNCWVEKPANG